MPMKVKKFWSRIWGKDVEHKQNAEWLKEVKGETREIVQENITITTGMVAEKVKKIPNWRVPDLTVFRDSG